MEIIGSLSQLPEEITYKNLPEHLLGES